MPVFRQNDAAGAAKELGARLAAGRAKYQKRMAAGPVDALPPAVRTARRRMADVLTEQRDALVVEVSVAKTRLATLETTENNG